MIPEELIDSFARPVAVVQSAVGNLPDGVPLARVADDCTNLYLVDRHGQPVAQQINAFACTTGSTATGITVRAP